MYVGRRDDGTIYGTFTSKQPDDEFHPNITELPDDDPEVVAFLNRPKAVRVDARDSRIEELEKRLASLEKDRVV